MLSHLNPIPTLPKYPGPHKVGTIEYEIPVSQLPSISTVPDPTITTVKFRIFYPTIQDASSKRLYWLPSPQGRWTKAYASFMGASPTFSSIISHIPSLLNYIQLPALHNTPFRPRDDTLQYPVVIFSHGLGGNCNTYSSIVGSLASFGIVCVAPEHRDGSAPISFVRNARGEIEKEVEYQKHSHSPSVEVLNSRNAQLRVRMWELGLIYSAINGINEGKSYTNYARGKDEEMVDISKKLNMSPGKVTWAGHSFGAATVTQFVKSVFYRTHLPTSSTTSQEDGWDWTPLYMPVEDCEVLQQITNDSPMALLDLWTMPLRGETTKWLWQKPLPCYNRANQANDTPNVVAIMSAEFYKWTDLLNRTRALLSGDPVHAIERLQNKKQHNEPTLAAEELTLTPPIPELSKQDLSTLNSTASSRSPSPSNCSEISTNPSAVSSQSSLALPDSSPPKEKISNPKEPHLYLIPQSAHLSQSDFGPLFPNLAKYVMKAIEPEKTIELNIRAILSVMRGSDLSVASFTPEEDLILSREGLGEGQRWVRVPLIDS